MASGESDPTPGAMAAIFDHPETAYVTVNSNKDLTIKFRMNIQDIPIKMEIIEDNGVGCIFKNCEATLSQSFIFLHTTLIF